MGSRGVPLRGIIAETTYLVAEDNDFFNFGTLFAVL